MPPSSPPPPAKPAGAAALSPEFFVSASEGPGAAVTVAVQGEVDVSTAPALRDKLYSLLADGRRDITLDLNDMTFIDSTGLGVLVGTLKRAREADGDVVLRNPSRSARKVLEISGLSKIVKIVD